MTDMTEQQPNTLVVWYGELTKPSKLARRGLVFLLPALLWLLTMLILPGLMLVVLGFAERGQYGDVVWQFTLENFRRVAGYGFFGWSPDTLLILWRSVVVAFFTTVISVLLAYPLAFFIASRPERQRYVWLTLVIVPFWTNLVIRAYAWMLLLNKDWPFAKFAQSIGLIPNDAHLYPGSLAVYLGMVSTFLPFVMLPLYSSVERMDWTLVEAAQDLYANRARTFLQAVLPQTLPGLTVGVILSFVPAMGMFVIPDLLGGGKYLLVGNLIQQQFFASRDWPYGAAICMVLLFLTLWGVVLYRKRGQGVDLV